MYLEHKKISGAEQRYVNLRQKYPEIFKQLEILTQPYQGMTKLMPQDNKQTFMHCYLPIDDIRNFLSKASTSPQYIEEGLTAFFSSFAGKYETQAFPIYGLKNGNAVKFGYIFTPQRENFTLYWIWYYLHTSLYFASTAGMQAINDWKIEGDNYKPLDKGITSQKFKMYADAFIGGDITDMLTSLWLLNRFFSDASILEYADKKVDSAYVILDPVNIPDKGFMIENKNAAESIKHVLALVHRLLSAKNLAQQLNYFRNNNILPPETLKMFAANLRQVSLAVSGDKVFINYGRGKETITSLGLAETLKGVKLPPTGKATSFKKSTSAATLSHNILNGLNSLLEKLAKNLGEDQKSPATDSLENSSEAKTSAVEAPQEPSGDIRADITAITRGQHSLNDLIVLLPAVIELYWHKRAIVKQDEDESTLLNSMISTYLNSFKKAFEAAFALAKDERRALLIAILNCFSESSFFELQKYILDNLSEFIRDFKAEDKVGIYPAIENMFFSSAKHTNSKELEAYLKQEGGNYLSGWSLEDSRR